MQDNLLSENSHSCGCKCSIVQNELIQEQLHATRLCWLMQAVGHTRITERCYKASQFSQNWGTLHLSLFREAGGCGQIWVASFPNRTSVCISTSRANRAQPLLWLWRCAEATLALVWGNPLLTPVPSVASAGPQPGSLWDINRHAQAKTASGSTMVIKRMHYNCKALAS